MSNIIKGEGLNEIELEKNTTEHTVMLHCQDGYSDCSVELSKDKAIELANKILEMCKVKNNIIGIGVNPSPISEKPDFPFEGYRPYEYFKIDNNKVCENCGCNPKNGGSGNCNCTLATPTIY